MIELTAKTASKQYPVFIQEGALDKVGELWSSRGGRGKVVIISDENVAALYLERLERALDAAGTANASIVVAAGESSKNIDQVSQLYSRLFQLKTRRRDTICALGGGVVGDLAGFVASTYMRGIGFIQIPTTLLAQVDSSLGGKVGVNITEAKNYVGSFYQPDAVIADPGVLQTLPREQMVEGLAEVVKYALLDGADFFDQLDGGYQRFFDLDAGFMEPLVRRCVEYKLKVVAEDEQDLGLRAVLNLGHSVGHGIEAAGGYQLYTHGQAVALGLLAAADLSQQLLSLPDVYRPRLKALLAHIGLPVELTGVDLDAVLNSMSSDKKADDLSLNMVLLKELGEPVFNCHVEPERLRVSVARLMAGGAA